MLVSLGVFPGVFRFPSRSEPPCLGGRPPGEFGGLVKRHSVSGQAHLQSNEIPISGSFEKGIRKIGLAMARRISKAYAISYRVFLVP